MKVKKIAALAVGAAMVGATIGFASAQPTVPEIPKDFFVKDGQPNVKIVVGSQGAALDVSSAADIAVALGTMLYTEEDVKVKDASVVVKKDVTEPVVKADPDDIPVFFNYYPENNNQTWKIDTKAAKDVYGWWNGAKIDPYLKEGEDWSSNPGDTRDYEGANFNYDNSQSYWSDGVFTLSEAGNVGWTYPKYTNPLNFTVKREIYLELPQEVSKSPDSEHTVSFKEGNVINYHVTIGEIYLNGLDDVKKKKSPSAFSDLGVKIPAGKVNVTMDFALSIFSYSVPDEFCPSCSGIGYAYGNFLASDPNKVLVYGLAKNDRVNLFGKDIVIVAVDEKLKNFGDYTNGFVYGTPYKPKFLNVGTPEKFGDYEVEVLDIDVNSKKALLKITNTKTGSSKTLTLYAEGEGSTPEDSYEILFNGGIYIKLKSVFIGISGTTAAQVEVATDLHGVKAGDELLKGWKVTNIGLRTDNKGNKVVGSLALTNAKELEDPITLFDTFKIQFEYKYEIGECKGTKYGVAVAWIDFDPLTKTETLEKTLEKGEELDGWTIDDIKVITDPEKTYVPGAVKPITVLDTEIMEKGLDKVDSNLILVGGPVVNSVTAALAEKLEVPSDYDGWKEEYGTGADSGVIKYIAECGTINGYGVVLVAGTDREGTQAAAEALMEYLAGLH